jgi:hypothetical protein
MLKVISHIALSVMLLFAATGMTINMHLCQDHLYDIAFNAPADDCCENDTDENTCHHDHDMAKSHHCEDESIKIESSQDFVVSGFTFNFEDSHSFELFFSTSQLMLESPVAENTSVTRIFNYKKPPPQEVVLSQIQSFLI